MTIFIAEVGINHHGDFNKALHMIERAKWAGATYVKSQYYDPEKVLGVNHEAYEYAKKCQFTKAQHEALRRYADELSIPYFVSVFDVRDVAWASQFGLMKIATRMNRNQEFISKVEACKLPTFMSVQPTTPVRNYYTRRFKLLWCIPKYPSSKEEVSQYPYKGFGLSSHCPDYTASLEAIKQSAEVVENHVCVSKDEVGCDIQSSITFNEYKYLIDESIYQLATR